jgi:prepilin-type N-terminal cleavage/methylation domain-containing protein
MNLAPSDERQLGFTLIELLVALGIFLLVCGAAFTLLGTSQQRYRAESQVLSSFQEARLGLDQMVRDINDSGYPPPSFNDGNTTHYASTPFAWSPDYTVPTPCTLGGTCTTPGDFDLIIETNPNPQDGGPVQWIRYQLQLPPAVPVPTLMRGAVNKVSGDDPDADTSAAGVLVPFVQNVMNSASAVPIFTYICDTPTAPQPQPPLCSSAGPDNIPANIREVTVTLIVAAPVPDITTGQPHLVQLIGRGRRINPNQ